ncbi:MAG TPA: hypothetical protein VFY93_16560 [Planctomycetota bacterium]|nr:hypothetical protein [Planctomycetota bacterium]
MRRATLLVLASLAFGQDADEPADSRLDEANKKAAAEVRRTYAREGKSLPTQLKGLRKEDLIVVGGLFDFVQEVLVAHRVEFTVITPAELEHVELTDPWRKVFLLNCHLIDRHFPATEPARPRASEEEAQGKLERVLDEAGLKGDTAPGKAIRERFAEVRHFAGSDYTEKGLARLGAAIRDGAWAMSTDWAVLVWEKALPGTIRWTGHTTYEEKIEVKPALAGRRDPLLEGVFPEPKARWWLETESYLFAVEGRHRVLVDSTQLGARYGGNRNIVVLAEAGKGRILHALPHAYLAKGNEKDLTAMQRLLVNLLVAKSLENWKKRPPDED